MIVLVLGGAKSLHDDVRTACAMCKPDTVVATNHAGRDYDGYLPHWASVHVDLFPMWIKERREKGRKDAGKLWGPDERPAPANLSISGVPNWRGSSGLLAVAVALEKLHADKVILCGVPLDRHGAHYDDDQPWRDASNYRLAWMHKKERMWGKVKSFGGWTKILLGEPTAEWIDGAA